jgi:hypothetical protein
MICKLLIIQVVKVTNFADFRMAAAGGPNGQTAEHFTHPHHNPRPGNSCASIIYKAFFYKAVFIARPNPPSISVVLRE